MFSEKFADGLVSFSDKFGSYIVAVGFWMAVYSAGNVVNLVRNNSVYLPNQELYRTEDEFKADLKTEAEKLGLDETKIDFSLDSKIDCGRADWGRGRYLLTFNPECWNRKALRHELYHLRHFSEANLLNALTFGQYEEWNATTYSREK